MRNLIGIVALLPWLFGLADVVAFALDIGQISPVHWDKLNMFVAIPAMVVWTWVLMFLAVEG